MWTQFDLKEHHAEQRVGKVMVVLGAALSGLTLLALLVGWFLG